jgi:hypothetical protein
MDASRTFTTNFVTTQSTFGFVSTTSSTPVDVTSCSVTIKTTGRPVMVGLYVSPDNFPGYIQAQKTGSAWAGGYVYIKKDSTVIAQYKIQSDISYIVSSQGVGSIATQGGDLSSGDINVGISAGANSGISIAGNASTITLPLSMISTLDVSAASTRTYTLQISSINGSTVSVNDAFMYAYEI